MDQEDGGDRVYCAFCKIPRRIYSKKHIGLNNVFLAAMVSLLIVVFLFQALDPRVFCCSSFSWDSLRCSSKFVDGSRSIVPIAGLIQHSTSAIIDQPKIRSNVILKDVKPQQITCCRPKIHEPSFPGENGNAPTLPQSTVLTFDHFE